MKKLFALLFFLCVFAPVFTSAQYTSRATLQPNYKGRRSTNPTSCVQTGTWYFNTASLEYRVCTAIGEPGTWTAIGSGAGSGLTDGDKGAITISASGTVWTLDAAISAALLANGSVSNTEFQYLDGVTSNIQQQINALLSGTIPDGDKTDISVTNSGARWEINAGAVTNTELASGIDVAKLGNASVSNTEFGYLDGVSSAIQPQLASKEPSISMGSSGQYFSYNKTWQTLNKSAVGLGNVDNTSDALKPLSDATIAALAAKNSAIQYQFGGSNVGAAGDKVTVNFAGAGVAVSQPNPSTVTYTIAGGGSTSLTSSEIGYGTGSGITSSNRFTFSPSTAGASIIMSNADASGYAGFELRPAGSSTFKTFFGYSNSSDHFRFNANLVPIVFMQNSVAAFTVNSDRTTTFAADISVPAEAYGSNWNGSNEAPTKNDLYDKIETIGGGSGTTVNVTGGNIPSLAETITAEGSYDAAMTALCAIGTRTTVLLDTTVNVSGSKTVCATVVFLPVNDGKFVESGTGSLTFSGVGVDESFAATATRAIFKDFEAGDVTFSSSSVGGYPATLSSELWEITSSNSETERADRADKAVLDEAPLWINVYPRTKDSPVYLRDRHSIRLMGGALNGTHGNTFNEPFWEASPYFYSDPNPWQMGSNSEFTCENPGVRVMQSSVNYSLRIVTTKQDAENVKIHGCSFYGQNALSNSTETAVSCLNAIGCSITDNYFEMIIGYSAFIINGGNEPHPNKFNEISRNTFVGHVTQIFGVIEGEFTRVNNNTVRLRGWFGSSAAALVDVEPNQELAHIERFEFEGNHFDLRDMTSTVTLSVITDGDTTIGVPNGYLYSEHTIKATSYAASGDTSASVTAVGLPDSHSPGYTLVTLSAPSVLSSTHAATFTCGVISLRVIQVQSAHSTGSEGVFLRNNEVLVNDHYPAFSTDPPGYTHTGITSFAQIDGADNFEVSGNSIQGTGIYSIVAQQSRRGKIFDNRVSNGGMGIYLAGTQETEVYDNTAWRIGSGLITENAVIEEDVIPHIIYGMSAATTVQLASTYTGSEGRAYKHYIGEEVRINGLRRKVTEAERDAPGHYLYWDLDFNEATTSPAPWNFTSSDINHSTETITKTAHGLNAGAMLRYLLSDTGCGGTATAAAGLGSNGWRTNQPYYYVVSTGSANTFKLASSYSKAIAGTADIDLTNASGCGTHQFAVALEVLSTENTYGTNTGFTYDLSDFSTSHVTDEDGDGIAEDAADTGIVNAVEIFANATLGATYSANGTVKCSNSGFGVSSVTLGTFGATPVNQWTRLTLENTTFYKYCWIEGNNSGYYGIPEIRFMNGRRQLNYSAIYANTDNGTNLVASAYDGDTATVWATGCCGGGYTGVQIETKRDNSSVQTSATYAPVSRDDGNVIRFNNSGTKTVTINGTATLGLDFDCEVLNLGAGAVAFSAGSGVTIRNNTGNLAQWKRARIEAIGTDEFVISYFN